MKTAVIKQGSTVIAQIVATDNEYSVLKLALKFYKNGYGLSLLRKLNKAERYDK